MEGDGVTMGKAAHFLGAVGTGSKMKLVVNMTMGTMMNSLVSEEAGGRQEADGKRRADRTICSLSKCMCWCPAPGARGGD